jgi:sugar fermentation stimulation protein A
MADIREVNGKQQDKGVYILLVHLDKTHKIKPGRLPEADYERGTYLYVGRAKTGLQARLKRHLRKEKKRFWHIDYLLEKAEVAEVWIRKNDFAECDTAGKIQDFIPSAPKAIHGFGSSDCRCPSHLFYFAPETRRLNSLRKKLGFNKVGIDEINL